MKLFLSSVVGFIQCIQLDIYNLNFSELFLLGDGIKEGLGLFIELYIVTQCLNWLVMLAKRLT